jgi:hypothetical protein
MCRYKPQAAGRLTICTLWGVSFFFVFACFFFPPPYRSQALRAIVACLEDALLLADHEGVRITQRVGQTQRATAGSTGPRSVRNVCSVAFDPTEKTKQKKEKKKREKGI